MSTDRLFLEPAKLNSGSFSFNEQVAEVFDDMLERSVPEYRQVIEMYQRLLDIVLVSGDSLYDLGCSTGNTLVHLARRLAPDHLRLYGIDSSPAMIKKAQHKEQNYSLKHSLVFEQADILSYPIEEAGAIILSYTLQFIRPLSRPELIKRLYRSLRPGGLLLLSEKVVAKEQSINSLFVECYLSFKRERGYSEIEISKKREALENILIPLSIEENRMLLLDSGFKKVEVFFQWFNFCSIMAIREP